MTKRKENPQKRGRKKGQLSKYQPEFAARAADLCWLGATDADLAARFGVGEATIRDWQQEHPEFGAAIKGPREEADSRVVESLYRRATGYTHEAVKIMQNDGVPVIVPYTERYPPDSTAMIFWLKNRRRAEWRDKHDVEHTAGGLFLDALKDAISGD